MSEEEKIEELRNQNAELRDELEAKNAELNKEKEKNKVILKGNVDNFQKLFAEEHSKHFISKDKIKAKIEEVNNEELNYSETEYYLENEIKGYAIDKLQELLPKEE